MSLSHIRCRSGLSILVVLLTSLAACGGRQQETAGGQTGQPSEQPRGMMGGGMMGRGMHGAADTGAAPEARASTAHAAGCPDVSQQLVDAGRRVFSGAGNCYACHGGDAKGTAVAPDLTDASWLSIDGSYSAITGLVREGVPQPRRFPAPMPPMGGARLDSTQVCAVAAYVYSLSPRL